MGLSSRVVGLRRMEKKTARKRSSTRLFRRVHFNFISSRCFGCYVRRNIIKRGGECRRCLHVCCDSRISLKRTLGGGGEGERSRSEEHTSELQSRFGISHAVFCLKKRKA